MNTWYRQVHKEMDCMCSELSIMSIDYNPFSHLNFCTWCSDDFSFSSGEEIVNRARFVI